MGRDGGEQQCSECNAEHVAPGHVLLLCVHDGFSYFLRFDAPRLDFSPSYFRLHCRRAPRLCQ